MGRGGGVSLTPSPSIMVWILNGLDGDVGKAYCEQIEKKCVNG